MNKTLIKNTVALVVSNVFVRILGLLYKVWLAKTISAQALGMYQLSLSVYMLFISLPASGLPGSISRHYASCNDTNGKKQIVYEGFRLGILLSVLGGGLMMLFAPFFSWLLLKDIGSFSVFLALAPAIIFGGAASAPYGYLHASSKSTAVAISEFIEQLGKIILVFCFFCIFTISSPTAQATVAILGISVGGVISYILIRVFMGKMPHLKNKSVRQRIIKSAAPLTANRFITSFLGMITASIIPIRLVASGVTTQDAFSLYGIINGMALPIIMLPGTLVSALCVTMLPRLSAISASGNIKGLKQRITKILVLALTVCGTFSALLMIFSLPIGMILYSNPIAAKYIRLLAPCCVFAGTNQLCSTMLTSMGHEYKTFKIHVSVSIASLVSAFILSGIMGADGYALTLILQNLLGSVLFLTTVMKCIKNRLPKQ